MHYDFGNEDNYRVDYDRNTLRGNWDLNHFTRNGNVWALRSDDDTAPTTHTIESASRDRSQTALSYRNGSVEGGSWRFDLQHYDLEVPDSAPAGLDDSRMTRFDMTGRLARCRTTLDAGVFAGSYRSERALIDNDFSGARFDGSQWLAPRLELEADGSLTRIDAGVQNASATRSDYSAELGWDMSCDLRLSAFARGYDDDSDISAGSTIRSWRDTGAQLEYRPDGDTTLSARFTSRDIDTERLALEDANILPFTIQFNPIPSRADLAGLRISDSSSGELLDLEARHRFNCRFYAGASYKTQDFSNLPLSAELFLPNTNPTYFADHRAQASLHAAYDLCDIGNVTFRADTDRRTNSERGSSFSRDQYTLGYSAPLCRSSRLGLGVTRQSTTLDIGSAPDNLDASGWNYSLDLSGTSDCTNYVISAHRATSDGHDGGDLSSLGLELDFNSPWEVSAWWRQFEDYMGGRNSDDLGIQLGYRIDL
jgi:hypothetical protein